MDDQQVITKIKTDLTWLQKHERIVLALLLAVVLLFTVYKVTDHFDKVAEAKSIVLQAQLDQVKTQNKIDADNAAAIESKFNLIVDTLSKQNSQLATAISTRNTVLVAQQTRDKVLPPSDLATRWKGLIGGGDIAVTDSGFNVSAGAGINTVLQLEEVPVLQSDVANETTVATNEATELNQADTLIGSLNTQVTGLNAQIKVADQSCQAQISVLKKQGLKAKIKWFLAGVVVGFIGRGQI